MIGAERIKRSIILKFYFRIRKKSEVFGQEIPRMFPIIRIPVTVYRPMKILNDIF